MMHAVRNKALGKNRFKIEISIKNFGCSVKFDERKKGGGESMGLTLFFFFAAVGLGKISGTLRWLIVQQTEK